MSTEISEADERVIKRQEIKDRIAKARVWNQELDRRRAALHECIDKIENKLPAEYESRVSPWQTELGKLQDEAVELAIKGETTVDAETEKRREELRGLIDQAGTELEEGIQSEEIRQRRLLDELKSWQLDLKENVISILEGQLANLVSLERKNEHFALKQFIKQITQWNKQTHKELTDWRAELARGENVYSPETRQRFKNRLPRVEAVLKLGQKKLAEAQSASEQTWKSFLED